MRRSLVTSVLALAFGAAIILPLGAQSKPVPGFADYGKWETVSLTGAVSGASAAPAGRGGGRGGGGASGLSADGKWLGTSISKINQEQELRLLNLESNKTETTPFGSQLTYTADSKWAAWSVGYSQAQQERMRAQNQPIHNKLEVMNLASGDKKTFDGVQSFSFSPDGQFVEMRRYAPTPAGGGAAAPAGGGRGAGRAGGGGGGAEPGDAPGITIIIHNLATGADTTFGNVGESAWKDTGATLAMTISAADKAGNGVHLFSPSTGALRVLDSSAATYTALVWRRDSSDLLVMRGQTDDKKDGSNYQVIAWTGVGSNGEKKVTYDSMADGKLPSGDRVVSFRRPSWSEDGKSVFLGVAKWEDKLVPAGRAGGAGGRGAAGGAPAASANDEMADVAVWHWKDTEVNSAQKLSAAQDRRRNLLAVWHLDSNVVTPIGHDDEENVQPIRGTNTALVQEWSAYAMQRSIGRPATDLAMADLSTGTRTPLKKNISGNVQLSTNGKYAIFVDAENWWTINLATKAVTNITKTVPTAFVNRGSDDTGPQKPMFGVAGWTKNDDAVLLYDQYDIWQVSPNGTSAKKLTDGKAERVRHRLVSIDGSNAEGYDMSQPQFVALFGAWSKKSGYGSLRPGGGVDRLIFEDTAVSGLGKARDANVFVHIEQNYDDSPDAFISSASLSGGKQVTATNAFQRNYAWGKSETIEYTTDKIHNNGEKLQGTLYYPAGYEPGKQYPMIVYIYETLSDNVHQYVAPSDRSYYNTSVFTTNGYFVLQPDITFRPTEPGLSVVECVVPAVKATYAKGVDPKRVGVVGHSWGGFDTAFLATHTNGIFAGAVAGAAITDLVSNYGNGHWSSGIAETDHIETGQQRMVVPLYDNLDAYVRNSAVFNVKNMTVPLMLEVGNQDGTVFWHQGVELYNIARRAGKNVVMIEYNGEDHGLGQYKNQKDYQQRILQWFGTYLKGEKAPTWISDGQSYIERQDEVRKKGGGRGGNESGR